MNTETKDTIDELKKHIDLIIATLTRIGPGMPNPYEASTAINRLKQARLEIASAAVEIDYVQ